MAITKVSLSHARGAKFAIRSAWPERTVSAKLHLHRAIHRLTDAADGAEQCLEANATDFARSLYHHPDHI